MKIKKLNKKGIFFTLIAITMMTIFVLIFSPPANISLQKNNQAIRTRINNIDSYVNDLQEAYFQTALRAATYKTMLSLIYYMNTTGEYLTDLNGDLNLNGDFSEVIINGTIKRVPIDEITRKKIMYDNTLTNWSNRIINISKNALNVNTTIVIYKVFISQTKPWALDAQLELNFSVKSDVAVWGKNATIKSTISIEGLPDPYYLLNTRGPNSYSNIIKRSSVGFDEWDLSKTREHLRNGTNAHWENSEAPSFLMRFTNTIAPSSCCGIESLVNPNKISPSDQRETYVDYLFWTHAYNARCAELYDITNSVTGAGLWDEFQYFKLDINHVVIYKIPAGDVTRDC